MEEVVVRRKEKVNLVPKLRFHEFTEVWSAHPIGSVFSVSAGGDVSKANVSRERTGEYVYPIYANAETNDGLFGFSDIYTIESPSVTVTGRGNIGIAHAREGKFYPIVRLLVLTPKEPQSVPFFAHALNLLNIHPETTGVPQLTAPQISGYSVTFPTLPEQQKIAAFLGAADRKIQQLKRKQELLERYKKGVVQQLFSQELRFKRKDGGEFPEWEDKRLGDVLTYEQPTKYIVQSTEYSDTYPTPVLTAGKTFILGYTDETKGIHRSDQPVIIFDDFTTANKFVDFDFKVKSSAMKILSCDPKRASIKFVFEAMQQIDYVVGDHKRHWISIFEDIEIPLPSLEEQSRIAGFLMALDAKVAGVAQAVAAAQKWKKGLLQQMFV